MSPTSSRGGGCDDPAPGKALVAERNQALPVLSLLLLMSVGCSTAPQSDAPARKRAERHAPTKVASLAEVTKQVKALADSSVELKQTPGVIALVRMGDNVRVVTAGVANIERKQPPTAAHRFPIASITKSMVAAVVMQLVQDRELSLDDTVEDWLPGVLRSGQKITVEHLLSHRSGLPEYLADEGFSEAFRSGPLQPREFVRLITAQLLEFEPGTASAYSNTNYIVLGLIIEAVTGDTLAANLESRIFQPSGMSASSLGPDPTSPGPMIHGYSRGKDVTRGRIVEHGWADGGVVSTVEDVSRFYRALFSGRIVQPDLVKEMTSDLSTIEAFAYGLGIANDQTQCGMARGHTGREPGYFTDAWTLDTLEREVVVMINIGEDVTQTGPIAPIVHEALCG